MLAVILYLILTYAPGAIKSTPADANLGPLIPLRERNAMTASD